MRTQHVHFIRRFRLLLLIGGSLLLFACSPAPVPALPQQISPDANRSIVQWIKQHAHALTTTDPQASLADLEPLRPIVGSAAIVGLGEETHGSHELFTMKHRLLEFLVTQMGFRSLVMEIDWGTGLQINDYILTGHGDPEQVIPSDRKDLVDYRMQEIVALLQWLRAYNADPQHTQKVQVVGMDLLALTSRIYDIVQDYVQHTCPDLLPEIVQSYTVLRSAPQVIGAYLTLPQGKRGQYATQAQFVSDLLQQHQRVLEQHSSPQQFAWAFQNAHIIAQFTHMATFNDARFFVAHDMAMAENVAWVHAQAGKTVVWAHDGHIGKKTLYPAIYQHTMGEFLQQRFGQQYLAISTTFSEGVFHATKRINAQPTDQMGTFSIPPAIAGSYNATLGQVSLASYLLDLRQAPDAVQSWLEGPHAFIVVPASIDPSTPIEKQVYGYGSLEQSFDVIVHLQQVTASHLL